MLTAGPASGVRAIRNPCCAVLTRHVRLARLKCESGRHGERGTEEKAATPLQLGEITPLAPSAALSVARFAALLVARTAAATAARSAAPIAALSIVLVAALFPASAGVISAVVDAVEPTAEARPSALHREWCDVLLAILGAGQLRWRGGHAVGVCSRLRGQR